MRRFDDSIEITRRTLEKKEALILRLNKKPLSEEDINHYAKVFGFDTDDAKAGCKPYTKEEKYLLAVNRYCYTKAAHLRACCRRRLGMGD